MLFLYGKPGLTRHHIYYYLLTKCFLSRLGMSAPKSKLTYEGFVSLFEEGRPESYSLAPQDVGVPQLTNASLNAEDAMTKLRNKVIANQATLYKVRKCCQNFVHK